MTTPPPAACSFTTGSRQKLVEEVDDDDLDEISGMAASRRHPGVVYVINGEGGDNEVYALDHSGNTVSYKSG